MLTFTTWIFSFTTALRHASYVTNNFTPKNWNIWFSSIGATDSPVKQSWRSPLWLSNLTILGLFISWPGEESSFSNEQTATAHDNRHVQIGNASHESNDLPPTELQRTIWPPRKQGPPPSNNFRKDPSANPQFCRLGSTYLPAIGREIGILN